MNDDISDVGPPRKKQCVENSLHEDREVEKMNQFRVAEFRLKRKIFVSQESEKDTILKPVEDPEQAFGLDEDFLTMLFIRNIDLAGPLQSQTWPVILHRDDVICICDNETDRRQAFLLPALFYIRNPPTPAPLLDRQGPTVLCVTATSTSTSIIKKEIDEFNLPDIKCLVRERFEDYKKFKNDKSKDQYKIIAATLEELEQIDDDIIRSISYVVLEQVDNMSETQIQKIYDIICKLSEPPQIIITSIKWTNSVQQLASKCCVKPITVKVDGSLDLTVISGITQQCEIIRTQEDKMKKALEYLKLHHKKTEDKVAVFCCTDDTIIKICTELRKQEIPYDDSVVRTNDVNREEPLFKDTRILIMNFAAIDLNLKGITHLINLEFPKHIEKYIEQINRIYEIRKGSDTKLISLLSEDDWPIVPDLVAVLREMHQVIPPALFHLANRFEIIKHYEKSHFFQIAETEYFIDKSLMIRTIIKKNDNYLLTAPRKFGKSSNLSMLDNFFNVATAQEAETIFKKLKIGKCHDIMKEHFGKYAVLKVDMSKFTGKVISVKTCNDALRQIINDTYLRYELLFKDLHSGHVFHKWCDLSSCRQLPDEEIRVAFNRLAMFLHNYYEKPVILICDEFDAICNAALLNSIHNDEEFLSTYKKRSESTDTKAASKWILDKALAEEIVMDKLDAIIRAYFDVFADLVKTDVVVVDFPKTAKKKKLQSIVWKSIFSGVTAVTCSDVSPVNSLPPYPFLENEPFAEFYGITIEEFDKLLEKPIFEKLREERDEALQFYNGYRTVNGCDILCTHSLCKYLCNVHEMPKSRLKSYWVDSGSIGRYTDVWKRDVMRKRLEAVVSNTNFTVIKFSKIEARDLGRMALIVNNYDYKVTDMDILFTYLQQLGYLTIKDTNAWLLGLGVPNEELRQTFVDILLKSILTRYGASLLVLKECSEYLTQLVDDNKVAESLEKIGQKLSRLCQGCPTDENGTLKINEATVEHLVYAMFLVSKFFVQSQIKVEREGVTNRSTLKILDLCFYRWNFGVVIEVKYGAQKTARTALMQIKDKGYDNVLKNFQIPMKIIKAMFIGIHVTEKGEATLDYTNNIENFSY